MKAIAKVKDLTIELEGATQAKLFDAWAQANEVFGESSCGLCQNTELKPVVRRVSGKGNKEFTYYELKCEKCGGHLTYGQHNEGGTLFPKRKLTPEGKPDMENGDYGKHRGWTKYRGEQ